MVGKKIIFLVHCLQMFCTKNINYKNLPNLKTNNIFILDLSSIYIPRKSCKEIKTSRLLFDRNVIVNFDAFSFNLLTVSNLSQLEEENNQKNHCDTDILHYLLKCEK